jgi:DNA-binding transcriptional LysR family regulator
VIVLGYRMIELRQFRQFVAVAEEMSFRRAAARLYMAQPPLTAAVRRMEEELGVTLLERGNRVTRLTEAGAAFLEEARRALAQADRAVSAAKRAAAGLTGSLRIGFVASAAHGPLPLLLRAFRERHAEVELELREATTAQLLAELRAGRIDAGLVVLPLADPEGLLVETVLRSQLVAVLPEGHRLAARRRLALAELAAERWVLFPARLGPGLYGRIQAACAAAGFSPRVVQEAVAMDTAAALVAGGLGVTLVPASLAAVGRRGVAFRDLRGPGTPVSYELALACRQDAMPPTAAAFLNVAREAAASGVA